MIFLNGFGNSSYQILIIHLVEVQNLLMKTKKLYEILN